MEEQQSGSRGNVRANAADFVAWARKNWRTTALGVVGAMAIVLQRLPDRPTWKDVAAAVLVAVLGSLATDNPRSLAPGSTP